MKALSIPVFRNYLLGSFVSEIGNQMQIVAISWQVYELTRNPASLGLIGVANLLPIIIFSLFGGLAADKVDRKKLLLISLISQIILAITLFLLTYSHSITPILIYIILFLIATAQSFSLPARQSIFPHLVPKEYLINALSLNGMHWQSATMIGPAIAGFIIGGFNVAPIYFINAVSFIFFIVSILSINVPLHKHNRDEVELSLSSIREGIKFVFSTPILYSTIILDFLATFFGEATILMPVFARDVLHVGPQGLGFLYSAPAIGGVFAGLLLAFLHHKIKHQGRIIIGSVILYGLATIAFGLSTVLPISLVFLVLVGFGDMVSNIIRNTIRQTVTPDYLRGRMASITRIFFQGGPQLGEIEAGFLAKAIGAPATVVIGGIGVILITSLVALKIPVLRKYQGKDLAV